MRRLRPDLARHAPVEERRHRSARRRCSAGRPPAVHVLSTAPLRPGLLAASLPGLPGGGAALRARDLPLRRRRRRPGRPAGRAGDPSRAKVGVIRSGVTIGGGVAPGRRREPALRALRRAGRPTARRLHRQRGGPQRLVGATPAGPGLARLEPRPFLLVVRARPARRGLRRTLCEAGLTGHSRVLGQRRRTSTPARGGRRHRAAHPRRRACPRRSCWRPRAAFPFVSYDIDGARELLRAQRGRGASWPLGDVVGPRPRPWSTCWRARTAPGHRRPPWSRDAVLAGYRVGEVDRADALTALRPA